MILHRSTRMKSSPLHMGWAFASFGVIPGDGIPASKRIYPIPLALHALEDSVVDTFVRHYAALPGDGIYFQSFTETAEEEHDGQIIADVVVRWVNRVCARILTLKPDLELQFGLHATSVRNRMASIAAVDPRIRIVWEDCGAFPYAYMPENLTGPRRNRRFHR